MRKSKALASIVLGAFLSLPSPAYSRDEKAGTSDTPACQTDKECFEAGSRAYAGKNYRVAAELFKRSYALTDDKKASSILLYNIAKAYENSRNFDLATSYYESYIKELPAAEDRLEIEKRLRFLGFYIQGRKLCQKGEYAEGIKYMTEAESFFASDEQTSTFLREDMDQCRSAEMEAEMEADTPSEKKDRESESAVSLDTAAEEQYQRSSFLERYTLPLITGGLAGALGVTGVVFNSLAGNKFADLKDTCAPNCSDDEVNGLENQVRVRNAAYISGIVAAVATGALFAWKSMDNDSPQVEVGLQGGYSSIRVDF